MAKDKPGWKGPRPRAKSKWVQGQGALARARLDECEELMLNNSTGDVQRILSVKWKVSRRTVRKWMTRVRLVWKSQARMEDVESKRAKQRERLERVFLRQAAADDNIALKALGMLSQLDNLNEEGIRLTPERVGRLLETLTPDEFETLRDAIVGKVGVDGE